MAIVLVRVTGKHWNNGVRNSCGQCMFSLAIQEATNDAGWMVDGDAIRHSQKDIFCLAPEWFDIAARIFDSHEDYDDELGSSSEQDDNILHTFCLDTETGEIEKVNVSKPSAGVMLRRMVGAVAT